MTVENLHDAIGQLPSDLIAQVDEKRQRRVKKVIPFRRIAAFAACFALVLCCGWYAALLFAPKGAGAPAMQADRFEAMAQEAPAEAAPMENAMAGEPESPGAEPPIPTYAAAEGGAAQDTIENRKDTPTGTAEALIWAETANIGTICFTGEPLSYLLFSTEELQDFYVNYGYWDMTALKEVCAGFDFETQDLVLVLLPHVSTTAAVRFQSLGEENGIWTLTLALQASSDEEACDRFVLVPISKGTLPQDAALNLRLLTD